MERAFKVKKKYFPQFDKCSSSDLKNKLAKMQQTQLLINIKKPQAAFLYKIQEKSLAINCWEIYQAT